MAGGKGRAPTATNDRLDKKRNLGSCGARAGLYTRKTGTKKKDPPIPLSFSLYSVDSNVIAREQGRGPELRGRQLALGCAWLRFSCQPRAPCFFVLVPIFCPRFFLLSLLTVARRVSVCVPRCFPHADISVRSLLLFVKERQKVLVSIAGQTADRDRRQKDEKQIQVLLDIKASSVGRQNFALTPIGRCRSSC